MSKPRADSLRVRQDGAIVDFRFDDRMMRGVAGEPIAAALHANGVRTLSRSFKYHRPRGLHCVADACPNCAMRVNGLQGVTTCVTPLRAGDDVRREHAWPSADASVLGVLDRTSRLAPLGFQYRRMRKSPRLFHRWERVLARLAGHGTLPADDVAAAVLHRAEWATLGIDVAVVGAGPAGLAAALAAAEAGASVLVIERDRQLGGYLLAGASDDRRVAAELADRAARHPAIEVADGATAIGWYAEGILGVSAAGRFTEVRPRSVVLATGTHERRWAFEDSDRPGVFLGYGAQRLLNRYGVRPGATMVVATDEPYGYELAAQLAAGGVSVAALVDARPMSAIGDEQVARLADAGIALRAGERPKRVLRRGLRVGLQIVDRDMRRTDIDVDAVALAGGRRPALELLHQRAASGGFQLASAVRADHWWVAGGAGGTTTVPAAFQSGTTAGRAAAGC